MRKILSKKVSQVMTRKIITLKPETHVSEIKRLFNKHDYNAFPVTNEHGDLVGIVSKTDFLRVFTMGFNSSVSKLYMLWAKTASDIMSEGVYSITPDSKLIDAANIMVEYNYRSVPVVRKKKLVGIITSSDIAKYTLVEMKEKLKIKKKT